VAARSAKGGRFLSFLGLVRKPRKPDARPNHIALMASRKQSAVGSTEALQRAVLLSLQNDARLSK